MTSGDLRRLDALVAEHVYGWTILPPNPQVIGTVGSTPDDPEMLHGVPYYSTDIALAIGVLEKLRKDRGKMWSLTGTVDFQVAIGVKYANAVGYVCPLPEAICRHVLHVLGVEV